MCDCCDPTSDSPDPVVVRLEREVEELRAQLTAAQSRNASVPDGFVGLVVEINALREKLAAAEAAATRANLLLQAATEAAFGRALTEEQVPHSGISDQAIRSAYELLDYYNEETEKKLAECRRLLREVLKRCGAWNGSADDWENFKREAAKAGGCDDTARDI